MMCLFPLAVSRIRPILSPIFAHNPPRGSFAEMTVLMGAYSGGGLISKSGKVDIRNNIIFSIN